MPRVKLFSHTECRQCVAAAKFLTENGIPFEEIDIERTPAGLDELVELTGSATHVPVIALDEMVFADFDDDAAAMIIEVAKRRTVT